MTRALTRELAALTSDQWQAHAERIFDGWQNAVTGFGTGRDKRMYGQIAAVQRLSEWELSALHSSSDMAGIIVDDIPDEAFRLPYSLDGGEDAGTGPQELQDALDELGVRGNMLEGMRWGRLFGGAAVVLGADDGRAATLPLIPEQVRTFDWLRVVDRRDLFPMSFYGEGKKAGLPETYGLGDQRASKFAPIHESRLIIWGGAETPWRERQQNNGWDYSVLQRPHEVLRSFDTGWAAVETMLTEATQTVFRMSGLADIIAEGDKEAIQKRVQFSDLMRSVMRSIVIAAEGDENFERMQISFAGIPETLAQLVLRMSAAARMPATRLMGQSPAGLSATGESDFRWYYDGIMSKQTNEVAPRMRRIIEIHTRSQHLGFSKLDAKKIKVKFVPLWTEPPLEQAQTEQAIRAADATAIDSGQFTEEEVALIRGQPGGMRRELVLTPEGRKAREESLKRTLERLSTGEPDPGNEPDPNDPNAPPAGGRGGGLPEDAAKSKAPPGKREEPPTDG